MLVKGDRKRNRCCVWEGLCWGFAGPGSEGRGGGGRGKGVSTTLDFIVEMKSNWITVV